MENQKKSSNSRREFLRTSVIGVAGMMVLPSFMLKNQDKVINIAFIGLGRQGIYLVNSFMKFENVNIVAGCDVYKAKRTRFENKINTFKEGMGIKSRVKVVEDYKDILKDGTIDAVVIASPDHWHALMAIDACNAKKDIYLEKPLTFTIQEGQQLVKAVRENKVILAVGSMQRSEAIFQHAVELVQNGRIGQIERVSVWVGENPHPKSYNLPAENIPEGLNWEMWTGPLPVVAFNNQLNPSISIDPPVNEKIWGSWRWYKEMSGGLMTDWGAHMIDIAQWGLKRDKSGPVKIQPAGFEGNKYLTYVYEDGIKMVLEPIKGDMRGVKFWGKEGWIEVARGHFDTSKEELKTSFLETKNGSNAWIGHHKNFLDAINSRKDPLVPVEVGQRSGTVCTLGNIANELNQELQWNPISQTFIGKNSPGKSLHYEYRKGYEKI
jgi:predicted dehydrogenase